MFLILQENVSNSNKSNNYIEYKDKYKQVKVDLYSERDKKLFAQVSQAWHKAHMEGKTVS